MKVLIVGGVAGGASTATRLRRLDENAEIIVFERGEFVSFANCGLPYYLGEVIKERGKLILKTPNDFKTRFDIDVRVLNEVVSIDRDNKTVTVRDIKNNTTYTENYDKLVLSPGALPIEPKFEIEDRSKVFSLRTVPDVENIKEYVEKNNPNEAAIIGGGYIGVEMAENLFNLGIKVSIIELSNHLIGPLDIDMSSYLYNYLVKKGINIILENGVQKIENHEGIDKIILNDGFVNADMVIMSVGVRPESKLASDSGLEINNRGAVVVNDMMQTSDNNIYALGDVIQVKNYVTNQNDFIPLAGPANRQARVVANNIIGKETKYQGTQGSSILKIFDMTIAMTGINEAVAQRENINYKKMIITANSHAAYYPDAKSLVLKVLYEKDTARILGAQIIGYEGVDKRCDVLATAIRAKMTAYDLSDLELCYAPPYSSAKDPVNLIGNAIENEIEGIVQNIYVEDLNVKENEILLDTRTNREYEQGYIEGAVHIPLDELRENLDKLDKSKNIIAYCQSGLRSYIANRILKGNGYNVINLVGGYSLYDSIQKAKK
jgi:NADPH-dependent 2,4-dienoyl-CoA reductase/sulfur reductase-like enzyme/rhodanese-related sulfurtransferase